MYKNNKKKTFLTLFGILSLFLLQALTIDFAYAQAQTVGDIAKSMSKNIMELDIVLVWAALICGLVLTIIGILKLKEHSDTRGQAKLAPAIVFTACGIIMLSITGFITVGQEALGLVGGQSGNPVYAEDARLNKQRY